MPSVRTKGILMIFAAALLTAALVLPGSPSPLSSEQAVPADSLVDSVGVNIHLHHGNTVYGNFPLIRQLLQDLHIRHIRDGMIDTTWKPYYERHSELGRMGIRGLFLTSPSLSDKTLLDWPSRVQGEFEGYEAPNEWDNSRDTNWAKTLNSFMPHLYQLVKNNPQTESFFVVCPSLIHASHYDVLKTLKAQETSEQRNTAECDYTNMHNYFGGRNPGTSGWGANGYGSIEYNKNLVQGAWPSVAIMTTETGYYTSAEGDGIPQDIEGTYLPRVILEQYLHSVRRTYLYELIDQSANYSNQEGHFGLANADGTPKSAYTALKNLIQIMADPGKNFSATPLTLSLQSANKNLHHLILQKRDGSYYIALWIERETFDVHSKTSRPPLQDPVRVLLTKAPHKAEALQFQSNGEVSKAPLAASTEFSIQASDNLLILHIQ